LTNYYVDLFLKLLEMKCLDSNDELTSLGRILAKLPIEPRMGKMMVLGSIFNCGDALSTIAANSSTFPEVFTTGIFFKSDFSVKLLTIF
jgi:ATP-dependent RNA helicase A